MTPAATVNAFYQAIIAKNAPDICSYYAPDDHTYVVLEGPRLTTRGFALIEKGWYDFCASGLSLLAIEWTEGPFEEIGADMAWVAGIIRLKVEVKGRAFEQIFRASFVLRKPNHEWKIRHEHVSGALADPYGIGDWLKQN